MSSNEFNIDIDAGRLLFGLSRIGYTTASAICDIIDNSVRAQAKNIFLLVNKERSELGDARKNNVREYIVIDDGQGMNDSGIKECLKIGSSDNYEQYSLSKYGLGLKTAAFSQGDLLEVISSDGTDFNKYSISLPEVIKQKRYFAKKSELDDFEKNLIENHLPEKRGTIIRINQIRNVNHPSVKKTIEELNTKVGVIYYYFLKDDVNISIYDKKINPIDVLFTSEADINGNLDENKWDGKSVKWIIKPQDLLLDKDTKTKVTVEITQLPYPPIFKLDTSLEGRDAAIRNKYLITSGNYGYYIYRNKRLIAWASLLNGIIPQDQDFFAFRGRILVDDSADEFFNIDVKKSSFTLSEDAWDIISDFSQEPKRKSKKAWQNVGNELLTISNKQPNEVANQIVDDLEQPDLLPGDKLLPTEEVNDRIEKIKKDMRKKVELINAMYQEDKGEAVSNSENISQQDQLVAIKGSENPDIKKIFRVTSVEDNLLWEPYFDTDLGECVRINKYHRFARLIYEDNVDNKDMQIIFELLLLELSRSELYAYKNIGDYKYEQLVKVLTEYRRIASEFLANLARKKEDYLPPNLKYNESY